MIRSAAIASAAALSAVLTTSLPAEAAWLKVGVLSCDVTEELNAIIVSRQSMDCEFRPIGGQAGRYTGVTEQFGLEIGKVEQAQLIWSVMSLSGQHTTTALAGKYIGAGAGAAVGVGLEANVLIGGLSNGFALQPLSLEGQAGFNIAAGVRALTLRAN